MPLRTFTLGLVWLATAALLALLGLLWPLRAAGGTPVVWALGLTGLLLPLPWCAWRALRRGPAPGQAAAEASAHVVARLHQELRPPLHAILGLHQLAL